jgi:hypothetical protein
MFVRPHGLEQWTEARELERPFGENDPLAALGVDEDELLGRMLRLPHGRGRLRVITSPPVSTARPGASFREVSVCSEVV